MQAVAIVVGAVFVVLAIWHFRMAAAPSSGRTGAIPSVDGRPLFTPSPAATVAVGVVLLGFAALIAAAAGLVSVGLSARVLSWICYALALGLLARAIGDRKYLGFFKRVRGSRFARLDTLAYSPLCLLLAIGVGTIGWQANG
jgi:hypothetical protein